jgi:hypothetical protein
MNLATKPQQARPLFGKQKKRKAGLLQASQSPEAFAAVSAVMRLTAVSFKLIDGRKRRAAVFAAQPTYSLLRNGPLRIIRRSVFLSVMLVKLLARGKFPPACLALELPVPHRLWLLSGLLLSFLRSVHPPGADRCRSKEKTQTARALLLPQ